MRCMLIVGARPQFIKVAPVRRALLAAGHHAVVVHTGQHYDAQMSDVFFRDLELPPPDVQLQIGSAGHGEQTGRMLIALEAAMQADPPDWVVVFGDTNSTLAGALAACKLQLSLAHVEAGLRSFNRAMPEEHNRVLADHCSDVLLCPTPTAVQHLANEGIRANVHLVGDVMVDALHQGVARAATQSHILESLALQPGAYAVATVHRPANSDDPAQLARIVRALGELALPVVFPVHPRTRPHLAAYAAVIESSAIQLIPPVGYLDMLQLTQHARVVLTDSGGLQKEAYCLGVPCVTLRSETEWTETTAAGWNVVVGSDPAAIVAAAQRPRPATPPAPVFGLGDAAPQIVRILEQFHDNA